MKIKRQTIKKLLAVVIILVSLGLLVYPFVSNYLFEHRTDSQIAVYREKVDTKSNEERSQLWEAAEEYNKELRTSNVQLTDPFQAEVLREKTQDYNATLNVDSSGIMSYLEIPKIDVYLPVYHGTDAVTLEIGIGHLEGSSLPVGGSGTHCVVSGHTGLKRAKLLTDLTDMERGDHFFFHTLGKTLAYEVDSISVVTPEKIGGLLIEDGMDYATLVTCTPYGVNTHRLLVRGKRIEWSEEKAASYQPEERQGMSNWMQEYTKALITGIVIVQIMFIIAVIKGRKGKK